VQGGYPHSRSSSRMGSVKKNGMIQYCRQEDFKDIPFDTYTDGMSCRKWEHADVLCASKEGQMHDAPYLAEELDDQPRE
jgi:hypothetical protein